MTTSPRPEPPIALRPTPRELFVTTLLTALPLGALIGLLLGALGGGGSILTVPALVYVLGEPARAATTESLVIVGLSAVIAVIAHARAGRVQWGIGVAFGGIGVVASYAGAAASSAVNPELLLIAFAVLMVAAAATMLARQRRTATVCQPQAPIPAPAVGTSGGAGIAVLDARVDRRVSVARTGAAALGVGFLTGFLGVGGGFLIVPALVMALGCAMPVAVGTSLLVIALNSATALGARVDGMTVNWALVVPFALAAAASTAAGKRLADRIPPDRLTRAFAALLIAVAGYTAITSASALIG